MDIDNIKELAKTVAESLNLKDFNGDIVALKVVENEFGNIEAGGIGVQNNYAKDASVAEANIEKKAITLEELGEAIMAVQGLFWGNSSYAVVFCAARDLYKHPDNGTLFEEEVAELYDKQKFDYPCPANTIASTFYNNSYLKLHVDKWKDNNVKQRSQQLVKAFKEAVEELRRNKKF